MKSNQCESVPRLLQTRGTFLRLAAHGVACDLGLHAGQNIVERCDAIDHALRQGSISAEHGIGRLKRDALARHKGAVALENARLFDDLADSLKQVKLPTGLPKSFSNCGAAPHELANPARARDCSPTWSLSGCGYATGTGGGHPHLPS